MYGSYKLQLLKTSYLDFAVFYWQREKNAFIFLRKGEEYIGFNAGMKIFYLCLNFSFRLKDFLKPCLRGNFFFFFFLMIHLDYNFEIRFHTETEFKIVLSPALNQERNSFNVTLQDNAIKFGNWQSLWSCKQSTKTCLKELRIFTELLNFFIAYLRSL